MSSARSTATGRQSLLPSRQLLIWLTTCAVSAWFVALKPTLQAFALDTFITLTLLLERGQRAARPLYVEYPACHVCGTDSLVIDAWTAQISIAISAKFYHPSDLLACTANQAQVPCQLLKLTAATVCLCPAAAHLAITIVLQMQAQYACMHHIA